MLEPDARKYRNLLPSIAYCLILPKRLEPLRRQFGIANGVLDVFMSEVVLPQAAHKEMIGCKGDLNQSTYSSSRNDEIFSLKRWLAVQSTRMASAASVDTTVARITSVTR